MKLFFTLFFIGVSVVVFGQLGSLACANAYVLGVNATCVNSSFENNQDGTLAIGSVASCAVGSSYQDIWFCFFGTGNNVTIEISPPANINRRKDATLAVWGDCSFTSQLACTNVANNTTGNVTISTTLGAEYYIQIQRRSGNASGSANNTDQHGFICLYGTVIRPLNDDPCNAEDLTVYNKCDFQISNNLNASVTIVASPGCGGIQFYDTWYKFTVPVSGRVEINTYAGTLTDGAMAIYSGTLCSALTLLQCNDDYSATEYMPYIYRTGLTPGATIWVRVWGYGGAQGSFEICVTEVNIPGDNPCTASSLPVNTDGCDYTTWNNISATNTTGSIIPATPSCAGIYSGKDVWYSLTVPASGNIGINTLEGTLYDGAISVYKSSGTCSGTLTEILCEEDEDELSGYYMPNIFIDSTDHLLSPGSTLWVRFWGYGGALGTYSICAAEVANPSTNQDCDNTKQLCASTTLADNNFGSGSADLTLSNRGCLLGNEHQSAWYGIQFETAGTFTFSIDPIVASDFDFAVWKVDPIIVGDTGLLPCPPDTEPIRCSWASGEGATGLNSIATDISETDVCSTCDGWVSAIDVEVGPVYYIMVDNYTANYGGFNIMFSGTSEINCFTLPITLLSFTGYAMGYENLLNWSTASELNNDYFEIQKSTNGKDFTAFGIVNGAGNSSETIEYSFIDRTPFPDITYYRLRQNDFNGRHDYSNIIAIANDASDYFNVFPNPSIDGNINVSFSSYSQAEINIAIYTISGQEILIDKIKDPQDFNQRNYQLPAKGIYTVVVSAGSFYEVKKVVY
ncbi:MAG: T9SS type A sorting domain-containing protein [Bacteroidetes bacterium]|nr:T9SS type A sorting domain-containing protein [Bacteroidota bacterium]